VVNLSTKEVVTLDPEKIDFENKEAVKNLIHMLLNIIESQAKIIAELREENQRIKDEINRLKGEKGKPKIKPNVPKKENNDINFIGDKLKPWTKGSKRSHIKIDEVKVLKVNKEDLPLDAQYKGYRSVIKQDIIFETHNIEYQIERYYSPSEKKVYEAEMPDDVKDSEFGSNLKAFVMYLHHAGRVTEPKIKEILEEAGIIISEGKISDILTNEKKEEFSREKDAILKAGLKFSDHFHIDDTGGRHKGINHYTHVICNDIFSTFFITRKKDKETIMGLLGLKEGEKIEKIMVSDDAKQFWGLAILHALCWLHEVRNYKKIGPLLECNRVKVHDFLTDIWKFYEQLKKYKENPDEKQKEFLERRFDELFSTKTGYYALDERIAMTKKKRDRLLLVLTHPWIPLHNNPAEIALRELVVKRKISYGTRSENGRIAWENMMSIMDTCRKQGVSFFEYVSDIFSGRYAMQRLADLIMQKATAKPTTY